MHCPSCGQSVTAEQQFCRACGMSLDAVNKLVVEHHTGKYKSGRKKRR